MQRTALPSYYWTKRPGVAPIAGVHADGGLTLDLDNLAVGSSSRGRKCDRPEGLPSSARSLQMALFARFNRYRSPFRIESSKWRRWRSRRSALGLCARNGSFSTKCHDLSKATPTRISDRDHCQRQRMWSFLRRIPSRRLQRDWAGGSFGPRWRWQH